MKIICIILIAFLLTGWQQANAQKLSIEKTYEITGKANRGYLGNINIDEPKNLLELTFVTKANDKQAKFETYQFDLEFNFKNLVTDQIDFDKAHEKYRWFKYKGESYVVEAVSVENNLTGTLILKRKQINYDWSWFWGGYDKDVKLLEKLKPKSDEGNKYSLITKAENDADGSVLLVAGTKTQKGDDPNLVHKKYLAALYNNALDQVHKTDFDFQYPQTLVQSQLVWNPNLDFDADADDLSTSDLALLFAPMGGPGIGKAADPAINNYTFIRFGNDASQKDRITIKSPNTVWNINSIATVDNNYFIFGPSKGDDKYVNQAITIGQDPDEMKWESYQLAKLSNGKVDFVNAPSLDEFESKLQTPPSQKKSPSYKGKKFYLSNFDVDSKGNIFLFGQNFTLKSDGSHQYRDLLCFHFAPDGSLKAQYGYDKQEGNKFSEMAPAYQELLETTDGNNMDWLIGEVDGMRTEKELGNSKYKTLMYPVVAKLDVAGGKIGDAAVFGVSKEGKYYLNNRFPFLPIELSTSVVFFGESSGGKKLWFGKMLL
ncbi:MAG: hypothetical protein IPO83_07200 [Chitinophagaceae bacterium]|nr:hypothetical protein [Chitinophagaceae bacterium]